MTTLLEKAVSKAFALPKEQQDALAQILLDEIQDEARWDASFARSQDMLAGMAAEAMEEYRAGETQPESPHNLNAGMSLTAVYQKVPEGYIAFVEELPGANTQGATLEEARANVHEAVVMVLEANRTLAEEELKGQKVLREPIRLGAG